VCDVARRNRTRRKKQFLLKKNQNLKEKIKQSRKSKTQKAKAKFSQEMFRLRERITEAKTPQSFQSALSPSKVPPNLLQKSRAPAEPWTFSATSPR
jgi:hypothetical protein